MNHQSKYKPIKCKTELHLRTKPGTILLELLTPETAKLLGSTKRRITKDKYGENVLQLIINEVVLVHFNN